jgi:DNA-binding NtrC family response regulator
MSGETTDDTVPDAGPGADARGQGQSILYIDDDQSLVFLVQRLLERRGYKVSGHVQQDEALQSLREQPQQFELVVVDFNMPGKSGLDVAREIIEIRPDLPIAIASGYITDAMREEAAGLGIRDLIFKPNAVEEFCEVVGRLLRAKEV